MAFSTNMTMNNIITNQLLFNNHNHVSSSSGSVEGGVVIGLIAIPFFWFLIYTMIKDFYITEMDSIWIKGNTKFERFVNVIKKRHLFEIFVEFGIISILAVFTYVVIKTAFEIF